MLGASKFAKQETTDTTFELSTHGSLAHRIFVNGPKTYLDPSKTGKRNYGNATGFFFLKKIDKTPQGGKERKNRSHTPAAESKEEPTLPVGPAHLPLLPSFYIWGRERGLRPEDREEEASFQRYAEAN